MALSGHISHGMRPEDFEKIVAEAYELVPENIRTQVTNTAILIEEEPSEEVRRANHLAEGETLLGLYHGVPKTERGDGYGVGMTMPDTITIFRNPILRAAADESGVLELVEWGEEMTEPMKKRVRAIVRDTIWHEIAHHFGMEEDHVQEREEEGTNQFKV